MKSFILLAQNLKHFEDQVKDIMSASDFSKYPFEAFPLINMPDTFRVVESYDPASGDIIMRRQFNSKELKHYEKVAWYEHDKDMKALSLHFPDMVFKLEGAGEDRDDVWVKYYHNGKVAEYRRQTFNATFNPNDLHDIQGE